MYVQIVCIAELIPFSALPLFGPEAGGTVITILYSFWAHGVMTSEEFAHNVFVTLDGIHLATDML